MSTVVNGTETVSFDVGNQSHVIALVTAMVQGARAGESNKRIARRLADGEYGNVHLDVYDAGAQNPSAKLSAAKQAVERWLKANASKPKSGAPAIIAGLEKAFTPKQRTGRKDKVGYLPIISKEKRGATETVRSEEELAELDSVLSELFG